MFYVIAYGLYFVHDTYWTKQIQFAKVFESKKEAQIIANEYPDSEVIQK